MTECVLSVFGVVPQRIGGVETFVRELSSQLGRAGWKSVVCFVAEPPAGVRRFLEESGVTIEVGPACSKLSWAAVRDFLRLIRRYRPAVLHLNFVDLVSIYPWLARCTSVRRILLTDQGSRPEGCAPARPIWWKCALRRALNWPVSRVVAVSDYVACIDDALGVAGHGNVVRIHNGVDLARLPGDAGAFRREYSIPENRQAVLQVSWIIAEKGILDLLDAAQIVLASNSDVQFIIAGEGPCRQQYMEYAAKTGIADHVTWTGLIGDPIAEGAYSAADVVCQLSRWEEAFGWVIVEAMASRKPVVATGAGGIPEIVEDRVTGFVVPRRQPAAAAKRILQLLGDAALRGRMGDAGRVRVEERFDLKKVVADVIALYGPGFQAPQTKSATTSIS